MVVVVIVFVVVDRRRAVYHAQRPSLLTTGYDERRAVAKLSESKVKDRVPAESTVILQISEFRYNIVHRKPVWQIPARSVDTFR